MVDDHSDDRTAEVASDAGAVVVRAAEVLPDHGRGHGKGVALWKSLYASGGDVVVWCDADVRDFDPRFVTGLLGPLLTDTRRVVREGLLRAAGRRPACAAAAGSPSWSPGPC